MITLSNSIWLWLLGFLVFCCTALFMFVQNTKSKRIWKSLPLDEEIGEENPFLKCESHNFSHRNDKAPYTSNDLQHDPESNLSSYSPIRIFEFEKTDATLDHIEVTFPNTSPKLTEQEQFGITQKRHEDTTDSHNYITPQTVRVDNLKDFCTNQTQFQKSSNSKSEEAYPNFFSEGESSESMNGALISGNTAEVLSPTYDAIIVFELDQSCSGEELTYFQKLASRSINNSRIGIDARQKKARSRNNWKRIRDASCLYEAIRIGLALSNRSGPIREKDYLDWLSYLSILKNKFQGKCSEPPDLKSIILKSYELDNSCSQLDMQVVLELKLDNIPYKKYPSEWLHAHATSMGMTWDPKIGFLYTATPSYSEDQEIFEDTAPLILFFVSFYEGEQSIYFSLDIPTAPEDQEPFGKMVGCALVCQKALGGKLVDAHGKLLNDSALLEINQVIEHRYALLKSIGLTPGSYVNLRIFS